VSSTRNILRVSRPTPYSSSESAVPLQVLSGCSECSVVSFGYSGNSELRTSDFELRTSNRPISTLCLPAGLFKQAIHSFSLALRTKIPPLRSKSKPTPEIRAQCRVSGLTLEFGEQSDETKTLFLGHSGAARGRWIVARLSAWHANALQQTSTAIDSETTPGPDSNRTAALLCPGFPDAADSWSKRWPESGNSTAARSRLRSESAIYRFYSRATSLFARRGTAPEGSRARVAVCNHPSAPLFGN